MDGRRKWCGVPLFGNFITAAENHRPRCPDCKEKLKPERYQPEWISKDLMSYSEVMHSKPTCNAACVETHDTRRRKNLAIWYGSPFYAPVLYVPTKPLPVEQGAGDGVQQRVTLPRRVRRAATDMPDPKKKPREIEFRPQKKRFPCASHHNLLVQGRMMYMGPPVGAGLEALRAATEKQLGHTPAGIVSSQGSRPSTRRHFPTMASSATQVADVMKHNDASTSKEAGGRLDLDKVRAECLAFTRAGRRPAKRVFAPPLSCLYYTAGYRGKDPYTWSLNDYVKSKKII